VYKPSATSAPTRELHPFAPPPPASELTKHVLTATGYLDVVKWPYSVAMSGYEPERGEHSLEWEEEKSESDTVAESPKTTTP